MNETNREKEKDIERDKEAARNFGNIVIAKEATKVNSMGYKTSQKKKK